MSLIQIQILQEHAQVRYTKFDGRDTLVVPVVPLVEGVHNGSAGPKYYSPDVLRKFVERNSGAAVPVYHPENGGVPISANTPEVIEKYCIGRVFYLQYQHPRVKGELWLDIEKTEKVYPGLIGSLNAGHLLEVSTGLFWDDDHVSGNWNGEAYDGAVSNLVLDHLAVLPDQIGACSLEDGCGAGRNRKGTDMTIRAKARKPRFEGSENRRWSAPSFVEYRDAYYRTIGINSAPDDAPKSAAEAPQSMKRFIAGKTLLGAANAATDAELMALPVVDPKTNRINLKVLSAIADGTCPRCATLPEAAKNSAQAAAQKLLEKYQDNSPTGLRGLLESVKGLLTRAPASNARPAPSLYTADAALAANAMYLRALQDKLQNAVGALDGDGWYHWMSDANIDEKFIIFEAHGSDPATGENRSARLFRQSFTLDEKTMEVSLQGEATQVREEKSFIPVTENRAKEEPPMPTKEEKIAALIANEKSPWKADHAATLALMTEGQLDALTLPETPAEPVTPVVPAETPAATVDEALKGLPPQIRNALLRSMDREENERKALLTRLAANTDCPWGKEDLEKMDVAGLEKVARVVLRDYSGAGGVRGNGGLTASLVPAMPPVIMSLVKPGTEAREERTAQGAA